MKFRFLLTLSFLAFAFDFTLAQNITIKGNVYHDDVPSFSLLIVNKTSGLGAFGEKDGSFKIEAKKSDTILIGALGFETTKICMADSADKESYQVKLFLERKRVELDIVSIFPQRELESIQEDIRSLGYDDRDYMLSGIDVLQSPITFLYQQFSKAEKQKRNAYKIINEDRKRALLKELFTKYVDYDIIALETSQFDDFIDFMNIPDHTLKSMSQYDFIMFTKQRYQVFKRMPPRLRQDIITHD